MRRAADELFGGVEVSLHGVRRALRERAERLFIIVELGDPSLQHGEHSGQLRLGDAVPSRERAHLGKPVFEPLETLRICFDAIAITAEVRCDLAQLYFDGREPLGGLS